MKNLKFLGRTGDIRDIAADILPDEHATSRIFEACDFEHDTRDQARRIFLAFQRLTPRERRFAHLVLKGKTWREMGLGKRLFNKRLATILAKIS